MIVENCFIISVSYERLCSIMTNSRQGIFWVRLHGVSNFKRLKKSHGNVTSFCRQYGWCAASKPPYVLALLLYSPKQDTVILCDVENAQLQPTVVQSCKMVISHLINNFCFFKTQACVQLNGQCKRCANYEPVRYYSSMYFPRWV